MMANLERPSFLERHYTIDELAKAWHMSPHTIRPWFKEEPGVLRTGIAKLKKGRKQTQVYLRIPESIARRVYEQKKIDRKRG